VYGHVALSKTSSRKNLLVDPSGKPYRTLHTYTVLDWITLSGDASDCPGADAASHRTIGGDLQGELRLDDAGSAGVWQGTEDARRVHANVFGEDAENG
jgi:hypothetical protein